MKKILFFILFFTTFFLFATKNYEGYEKFNTYKTAGVSTNFEYENEDALIDLYLFGSFAFENFGFSLFLPVRFLVYDKNKDTDTYFSMFPKRDWNQLRDFIAVITDFYNGHPDEKYYFYYGTFNGFSLANSSIVGNYFNTIISDFPKRSINFHIKSDYLGVQMITDDIISPNIVGGRIFVKPFAFVNKESYLNNLDFGTTVVYDINIPEELSVIRPRSRCPKCMTNLAWYDNIPILGWIFLKGKCRYCKAGKEDLCENIRFTGVHAPGGFAEYTVVHQNFAYPIPPAFSNEEAAPLMCAGVVGFRSLRLSEVKPGQRLGLYGFGASAHVIIQVAQHWNCEVYVFTRSPAHCQMALDMGAVWAGNAKDTPGVLMNSSIIFAPAGKLVPLALRQLDKGGVLALGGIHMSNIPQMPYSILWEERTIRSVANSTRQDVIDFLAVAAEIPVKIKVELYRLEDVNNVMLKMKRSQINGAAVLKIGA